MLFRSTKKIKQGSVDGKIFDELYQRAPQFFCNGFPYSFFPYVDSSTLISIFLQKYIRSFYLRPFFCDTEISIEETFEENYNRNYTFAILSSKGSLIACGTNIYILDNFKRDNSYEIMALIIERVAIANDWQLNIISWNVDSCNMSYYAGQVLQVILKTYQCVINEAQTWFMGNFIDQKLNKALPQSWKSIPEHLCVFTRHAVRELYKRYIESLCCCPKS